jgi:hypothetical protein
MGRLISYDETAEYLSVHPTTLKDYANWGFITRHYMRDANNRKRVMFDEDEVMLFDDTYPRNAAGKRTLNTQLTVSRCIKRERLANGEVRYRLRMKIEGESYARTFKTLRGAETHRDRKLQELAQDNATQIVTEPASLWRRLQMRMQRRPWACDSQ